MAATAEGTRLQVKALTGDNWGTWKFQIRLYLQANGLWNIVNGDEPRPDEDGPAATAWDSREYKAMAALGLTVDTALLYIVIDKTTSNEIWVALRDHFEKVSATNKYFLLTQLFELELKEGVSVDNHLKLFTELCQKLLAVNCDVPQEVKTAALLRSLPASYQVLRTTLQMKGDDLRLEEVIQAISAEDQQRRSGRTKKTVSTVAESAFQAGGRGRGRGEGRGRGRGGRNGRGFGRGYQQQSTSSTVFQGQCLKCGNWGHMARDCRSGRGVERAAPAEDRLIVADVDDNQITYSSDRVAATTPSNLATSATDEDALVTTRAKQWIVDSGASSHMTAYKSAIDNFREFKQPRHVRLGDGRVLPAVGSGNVHLNLMTTEDPRWPDITLADVLYVPALSCNLVSVRAILDKGKSVVFKDNGCVIQTAKGEIMATGRRVDRLFLLDVGDTEGAATATIKPPAAPIQLWHQRLGHTHEGRLKQIASDGLISYSGKELSFCKGCLEGKMARKPFKAGETPKTTTLLELVHSDVCGPMSVASPSGRRYMIVFLDDYSRCCKVYFVRQKSETFDAFQQFRVWAEKQCGQPIKRLRTDGGGEFVSKEFENYCAAAGIQLERSAPYCPQQNGAAERLNRTLVEMARSMLHHAGLKKGLWAEAAATAAFVYNRLPSSVTKETPYKRWCHKDPDLQHLRVWGCIGYAKLPDVQRHGKFAPKAERVRLIGYPLGTKGYKVISLETSKTMIRRDVAFDEHDFGHQRQSPMANVGKRDKMATWEPDLDDISTVPAPLLDDNGSEEEDSTQQDNNEEGEANDQPRERLVLRIPRRLLPPSDDNSPAQGQEEQEVEGEQQQATPRRSGRDRHAPMRYGLDEYVSLIDEHAFLGTDDDPRTIDDALKRHDAKQWRQAADAEFQALLDNRTWRLVTLPEGRKAVGCRWVFRIKRDEDGKVQRYKARLVAQGYSQKAGIDFAETYAPVVRFDTVRTLIALAAASGQLLHQVDVETAFLHGRLEEEVYMKQPPGYEDKNKPNHVCRLDKSLYGLKQSPRAWNLALHEHLLKIGFRQVSTDMCVYVYNTDGADQVVLAIYVDDILILAPTDYKMAWTKARLAVRFKIKDLGRAHHLLGIKVRRNEAGIHLSQAHYIDEMKKKFGFDEAKPSWVPADPSVSLVANDGYSEEMDKTNYQTLVGSLLYAAIATRPDISYAVSVVCRFTAAPTQAHYTAAKKVLKYLIATKNFGLYYRAKTGGDQYKCNNRSNSSLVQLHGYSDADWAGDRDSRRSTTGHCLLLAGCVVSLAAQRQPIVTLSSTEAEYVALSSAAQQIAWHRALLYDLGQEQKTATFLAEDNQGAMCLAKNPTAHRKTKHIDIKHHYVREKIADGSVKVYYVPTAEMAADIFTKALPRSNFERLRKALGLEEKLPSASEEEY